MKVSLLNFSVATEEVYRRLRPLEFNDSMPTAGDLTAEYAGRICYQSWDHPNPATATTGDYLRNVIARQHHQSIARHSSAALLVEGVSRHLLGELSRHHFLGLSVESLRYCPPRTYAVHPTLDTAEMVDELDDAWDEALARYNRVYERLRASGHSLKAAREAAAQFLPLATATDLVLSGNLNAWRDALAQRLPEGANEEIRMLARMLLEELKKLAPGVFQDFTLVGKEAV